MRRLRLAELRERDTLCNVWEVAVRRHYSMRPVEEVVCPPESTQCKRCGELVLRAFDDEAKIRYLESKPTPGGDYRIDNIMGDLYAELDYSSRPDRHEMHRHQSQNCVGRPRKTA